MDGSGKEEEKEGTRGDFVDSNSAEKNCFGSKLNADSKRDNSLLMYIEKLKTDMRRKQHAVGKKGSKIRLITPRNGILVEGVVIYVDLQGQGGQNGEGKWK